MDNLEKRLLEALLAENTSEFTDDTHRQRTLDELQSPIESIDQSEGVMWVRRVPISIAKEWDELPVSTRLLVWCLCREIQSLELTLDDYRVD